MCHFVQRPLTLILCFLLFVSFQVYFGWIAITSLEVSKLSVASGQWNPPLLTVKKFSAPAVIRAAQTDKQKYATPMIRQPSRIRFGNEVMSDNFSTFPTPQENKSLHQMVVNKGDRVTANTSKQGTQLLSFRKGQGCTLTVSSGRLYLSLLSLLHRKYVYIILCNIL